MQKHIEVKFTKPNSHLTDFVDGFWMLYNHSEQARDVVILPDGRVDVFFSTSLVEPYHVILLGLGREPIKDKILPKTIIFADSFKLLGV